MTPDVWAMVSLFGDPRIWGIIGALIACFYITLRVFLPDGMMEGRRHWVKVFSLVFSFSLLATLLAVAGIKAVTDIQRPCTPCEPGQTEGCNPNCDFSGWDSSFPSGHAATAFVGTTVLWLAFRKRWMLSLFLLSFLVAISRLMLGVHTPIDVIAGAAIGISVTWLVWKVRSRIPVFGIK